MELQEIRDFLALNRTLNFTKTAEACRVSQPALTRAIHKIEDELGGLLFSRERNNTHVTELGRLIEPQLAEIIGVDPVWWTPLKLIFEVSDAPLPNRLSAGVPATDD